MEPPIEFIRDHRDALGKLRLGRFMLLPWEQVEDHDEWGRDLIKLSIEHDVEVERQTVEAKSLTVVFNGKKVPPFEAIQYGIRRLDHRRFMRRDERKLVVAGHRVTPGGLVIPPA
ncbi:hypothetical protein ACFORH_42925 [Amycolatopsis roodepoortensis]|uniref:Uncharacterized protein n=1 Tax=Amycolatopsis roodepoortensis TaxID=700274 RepID=A0ABR9L2T4_9PSEU|nr:MULTISPECIES: hypothetical protein [Amycolatopsis]MBE1575074.1 hypothetical protein [Amycolatopsis roodepoortensis]GHG97520.1 hypothetical protein GCM10017788_77080 [Amycolatopsis acidiphila]